jgi:hypothetical protein
VGHEMRTGHQPALASAACACVAWLIVCIGCAAQRAAAPLPQAAPSSRKICGQDLPVLATEPKDDVPFVAPSTSVLADKFRRSLFPTGGSTNDLKLVKVHRDPAGQLFVYRPCGLGHWREIISDEMLVQEEYETYRVPIRATKKDADGFTLELDNSGFPPWIEARRRYQSTPTRGLYQITTHDALGSDLMMTVEEAAKLDIVVRLCRVEKLVELEC